MQIIMNAKYSGTRYTKTSSVRFPHDASFLLYQFLLRFSIEKFNTGNFSSEIQKQDLRTSDRSFPLL